MKPEDPRNRKTLISKIDRRSFLRVTGIAGGGLMLGVTVGCSPEEQADTSATATLPDVPFEPNAYVQISENGIVIFAPNPEVGQGVKTSLPMIVAEELDAAWDDVTVVQSEIDGERYERQVAGGSRSIPDKWTPMRQAGAAARQMLVAAAAMRWEVDAAEVETRDSMAIHSPSGRQLSYLELAAAAARLPVPTPTK
jgi:isoquinoline 1-oxidoreductase subunit beta